MNLRNKIKLIIIFFIFLVFFFSLQVFGEIISVCEFNNLSLKNYSRFAEIKIYSRNGITTGSLIAKFPILSNDSVIGYVYDNKESCDETPDDGIYCGIIRAKDVVNDQIMIRYSNIAAEYLNISIVNDSFAEYSIHCTPEGEYAICNITSRDKFVLVGDKKKNVITSFKELQGYSRNYELYQYTALCGKRKINVEVLFPDYIPPSSPTIRCEILNNNRALVSWTNVSDNFGVKKYELWGCGYSVNVSDEKKVTQYNIKNASCNLEKIKEFRDYSIHEFEVKCDNCELYYQIRVYDYFNNSAVSEICKTYTDSTKPVLEWYCQYPEKNIILYGDPVFIYYDKKYSFRNGIILNYSSSLKELLAYDVFGNFERYVIECEKEIPTIEFFNGKPNVDVLYSNSEIFSKGMKDEKQGKYFYYFEGNNVYKYENYINKGFKVQNSFLFLGKDINYSVDGLHKVFETNEEFVVVFKDINLSLNFENQRYVYSIKSNDSLLSLLDSISITEIVDKNKLFEIINQSISYAYYLAEDLSLKQKSKSFLNLEQIKESNNSNSRLGLITGWTIKGGDFLKKYGIPLLFIVVIILTLIVLIFIFFLDYFREKLFKPRRVKFKKPIKFKLFRSFRGQNENAVLPPETLKKIEEKKKMQSMNEEVKQKFINQAVEEDKKIVQKQLERKRWRFMR